MKKVMIIAAHPDDEVIGCSSLLLNEDYEVYLLHITKDFRNVERNSVYKKLGVNYYKNLNYPIFNLPPINELVEILVSEILKYGPNYIFGHFDEDLHQDHNIISRAIDIATRPNRTNIDGYFQYFVEQEMSLANCMCLQVDKTEKKKLLNLYNIIPDEHRNLILKFNEYAGAKFNNSFCEPFKIKYLRNIL